MTFTPVDNPLPYKIIVFAFGAIISVVCFFCEGKAPINIIYLGLGMAALGLVMLFPYIWVLCTKGET
jgi:hypothetical protein